MQLELGGLVSRAGAVVNGSLRGGTTLVRKLPKAYVHDSHTHGIAKHSQPWQITSNESTGRWAMTGLFMMLMLMFIIFLAITMLMD